MKKTLHHEVHRDHEEFLWGCLMLGDHQQGASHFFNNLLPSFAFFVVQVRNIR